MDWETFYGVLLAVVVAGLIIRHRFKHWQCELERKVTKLESELVSLRMKLDGQLQAERPPEQPRPVERPSEPRPAPVDTWSLSEGVERRTPPAAEVLMTEVMASSDSYAEEIIPPSGGSVQPVGESRPITEQSPQRAGDSSASSEGPTSKQPVLETTPISTSTERPAPVAPEPSPRRPFDWESVIGVRLFSWIAAIALLIATVYFLAYSIEVGWLGPPVRVAIGMITGIGLLVSCETKRAQRYRPTALALAAGGIAILFSTFFAAHALWHLIGALVSFALLALVAAVAVALSIRRDSIFIALLGLLGGFATPMLLSTGEDRPISLFSYLLLLNIALAWVAHRKRWPLLTAGSLGFTALYQAGWVAKFLHAANLPLAVGIFLVFPLVGFGAILLSRRRGGSEDPLFAKTASIGAFPPLLFALYVAVVPAYGEHFGLLFGLLFLTALGLAAVAAFLGTEWLHLTGAGSVLLVFACWLGLSYDSAAWPWSLWLIAPFVALYLGTPAVLRRLNRSFKSEGRLATYAAPFLLFVLPVLVQLEPRTRGPGLFFGALLLLLVAMAAYALSFEDGRVHLIAGFFALVAQATWSMSHLTPGRLLPALLAYAGFALFYLGVPLLAERRGKALKPQGSGAILLFASLGLLFLLATGPIVKVSLGALAVLLFVIPAGLLYEASRGRHPLLAILGIALSWVALAIWWIAAPLLSLLMPALVVMAAFALLALGGSLWSQRQAEQKGLDEAGRKTGQAGFLGLAGHGFLLAVVAQPHLAMPPWPWLAILGFLDLALVVASLWTKRGQLHLAGIAGSVAVLVVFVSAGGASAPGPSIAVSAALGLAIVALGSHRLAEQRGAKTALFVYAAEAALFGGQLVALLGALLADSPSLLLLLGFNLCMVVGILWLSWKENRPWTALGAVASSAVVVLGWNWGHPEDYSGLLWFATPLYLVLLFHPFVNERFRIGRIHYIASVCASAAYFVFGHDALMQAGLGSIIGLLPVTQALLLIPHLWLLVRMGPPEERDRGRIALVAAAVLAFVTAAIPLQLEKQWITLGWALQAAALAWLNRRVPHKGLVVWLSALLLAVFVRLTVNPAVLSYHPRSGMPVFNWYLYTYLVAAGAFFAAAYWLGRGSDDRLLPDLPRVSAILPAMGGVLLFLLLNLEIADFWSEGSHVTFDFSAGLAQGLSYTIGWGMFAIGLLVVGVVTRTRLTRVASIVLLAVTVLKAFFFDLKHLEGLYRVASFVGLAICLMLVALVLQRFVLSTRKEKS